MLRIIMSEPRLKENNVLAQTSGIFALSLTLSREKIRVVCTLKSLLSGLLAKGATVNTHTQPADRVSAPQSATLAVLACSLHILQETHLYHMFRHTLVDGGCRRVYRCWTPFFVQVIGEYELVSA